MTLCYLVMQTKQIIMRIKITPILIFLILIGKYANGQEFYEDGSMKLFEVSADEKYGFKPNHKSSIKVGDVENEQAYLKSLRGPNGEQVQFKRMSSCCQFKSETAAFGSGFLDKYEVFYQGLNHPIILYLNGYDYETPKAPVGFTFVTANKIEKLANHSEDSTDEVGYCNVDKQYAVGKEFLLKEKIGETEEPDTNPSFEGGIGKLRAYFAENPLKDKRVQNSIFRVAIAFVVDCNGKAGNFMIITKGKGLTETFANQVLERVNKMPQKWIPATKEGNKVDCHQVLSFTVVSGQLDKVSYR